MSTYRTAWVGDRFAQPSQNIVTEDTRTPQSGSCIWLHQPACFSCGKRLPALKRWTHGSIVCLGKKTLPNGAQVICGTVNYESGW